MPIRINDKNKDPLAVKYGRITLPMGTFLSNPSTAADGVFGAASSLLPASSNPFNLPSLKDLARPGMTPVNQPILPRPQYKDLGGTQAATPQVNSPSWTESLKNYLKQVVRPYTPEEASQILNPLAANAYSTMNDALTPKNTPTSAFNAPKTSLTGQDLSAYPNTVGYDTLQRLIPGQTFEAYKALMESKGYVYDPKYRVFDLDSTPNAASGTLPTSGNSPSMGELDQRGRPQWVDPTTLAQGERVTTSSGLTFVGGTPTAEGKAQYAITIPGGREVTRYKSYTKQDENGNWVKIYIPKPGKGVNKGRSKNKTRREEEYQAQQQAAAQQPVSQAPAQFSQLVNLRADYG